MPQLLLTLALIAIGWFLIIRPQQTRLKRQRLMVESLTLGDTVVTAGGIHGTVTKLSEDTVQVEVAAGVELTLARGAIGRRISEQLAVEADHVEDDVPTRFSKPGDSPTGGATP